jgi:hypothetical protein
MMRMKITRIAPAACLAVVALMAGGGCGNVTDTRAAARDQATKASCDYFMRCNQIGSAAGATFPDRPSCEIQARSYWESTWPAPDCTGLIRESELSTCLNAIAGTQCGNGIAFLFTLGTCSKANVCILPPGDGGGG